MCHKISTQHNIHTLREGGVETSEVEDEEDLVEEEVRLHAITMENLNIILDIFRNLERHFLTTKHMTIIWSDVQLIAKWKARNVVGPNPMQNLNPNPNTTLNV